MVIIFFLIRLTGVEPVTLGTEIQSSIQLSYKRKLKMIQQRTLLKVADNSGAKIVRCIKVLGGFKKKHASLGDTIVVSVQKLRNKSKKTSKVKKKEVYRALIIRTKKLCLKKDGNSIAFQENSIALINKQGSPIGSRIMGPLPKILKTRNNQKFISISSGLI